MGHVGAPNGSCVPEGQVHYSHVGVTWEAQDRQVGARSRPNLKSHSEHPLVPGEVMSLISTTWGGSGSGDVGGGRVTCLSQVGQVPAQPEVS